MIGYPYQLEKKLVDEPHSLEIPKKKIKKNVGMS